VAHQNHRNATAGPDDVHLCLVSVQAASVLSDRLLLWKPDGKLFDTAVSQKAQLCCVADVCTCGSGMHCRQFLLGCRNASALPHTRFYI